MIKYASYRLLLGLPTLVLLSILVFASVRVLPGDVCALIYSQAGGVTNYTPADCANLKSSLGLNKPAVTQYFDWTGGILQGNFGQSIFTRKPVGNDLKTRMSVTLELAFLASSFSLLVGVPIGVISAVKQNGRLDYGLRLLTIGWLSMPAFWIATLLLTFPAKWWAYAPPVGYVHPWEDLVKNLQQLYLPAFTVGLAVSAATARLTRSSMLEVLREDFVRTARAKGLSPQTVLYRHALRTAMLPIVTLFGLQVTFLLSGSLVVELIFALPGVGSYLLQAALVKDFPIIQACVLFFGALVITINIMVDISYSWLDPRIRRA